MELLHMQINNLHYLTNYKIPQIHIFRHLKLSQVLVELLLFLYIHQKYLKLFFQYHNDCILYNMIQFMVHNRLNIFHFISFPIEFFLYQVFEFVRFFLLFLYLFHINQQFL